MGVSGSKAAEAAKAARELRASGAVVTTALLNPPRPRAAIQRQRQRWWNAVTSHGSNRPSSSLNQPLLLLATELLGDYE